ncbi:MAG: DUF11 domain-containing protein [Deltaproteobacteria bacterium]|nr:DUF11 domain-containing protein [Deltaproteobacteria bacterium]
MRAIRKALAVLAVVFFAAMAAHAEEKGSIKLTSLAETDTIVVNAKGEKEVKRVEAARAKVVPGDVVIYTTLYENVGKAPVTDAVINNPVPEHMLYVDNSAEGKGTRIEFSVDGGKTFGATNTLTMVDVKGKARPARPTDYTNIRWTMEKAIAPGASGGVSFKAKIE